MAWEAGRVGDQIIRRWRTVQPKRSKELMRLGWRVFCKLLEAQAQASGQIFRKKWLSF